MKYALRIVVAGVVLVACGGGSDSSLGGGEDSRAPSASIAMAIADVTPAATVTPSSSVRALVELAIHDSAGLDATIASLYAPSSASFRQYLTRAQLLAQYAPTASDVATATSWLTANGLTVVRVSADNLFIEVNGTASAFGTAFNSSIVSGSGSGTLAYAWGAPPTVTGSVASIIVDVLAPDAPPTAGGPPVDTGTVSNHAPQDPDESFDTGDIATAYGAPTLYAQGFTGSGVTIGIAGGGAVRATDRQTFWNGQGITRSDVTTQQLAEAPSTFNVEATVDQEWSAGIAPGANVIFYQGPDNHDGSLLFAVNEAVGNDVADIVSDSFAHQEALLTGDIVAAYDVIGRFAAAMGVTLLSAAGDSSVVDSPAVSPWFTAVGGTTFSLNADGSIATEVAWVDSGCGRSKYESAPAWQTPAVYLPEGKRAVVDISLQADTYFFRFSGSWRQDGGTSFASPTTAGLIALVDASRFAAGKPRAGYLNTILYSTPSVQASFNDVTSGKSGDHSARAGWDYPTGWGSMNVASFAAALP